MKWMNIVCAALLVSLVVGASGCKKKQEQRAATTPMVIEGVSVDLPKLSSLIEASGNADLQSAVGSVKMDLRYRQFEKALMDMEKLSGEATLNEEQKKVATDVLDQIKQVAQKAPPAQ